MSKRHKVYTILELQFGTGGLCFKDSKWCDKHWFSCHQMGKCLTLHLLIHMDRFTIYYSTYSRILTNLEQVMFELKKTFKNSSLYIVSTSPHQREATLFLLSSFRNFSERQPALPMTFIRILTELLSLLHHFFVYSSRRWCTPLPLQFFYTQKCKEGNWESTDLGSLPNISSNTLCPLSKTLNSINIHLFFKGWDRIKWCLFPFSSNLSIPVILKFAAPDFVHFLADIFYMHRTLWCLYGYLNFSYCHAHSCSPLLVPFSFLSLLHFIHPT